MISGPLNRREFLKAGAAAGGALVVGFYMPVFRSRRVPPAPPAVFAPNAWLRIDPDGVVTVLVHKSEMGQGVLTSLPMLVAEELDADWSAIRVEQAPVAEVYFRPEVGEMITGGSSSVRTSFEPLRRAGAAARAMLVAAAAQDWAVPPASCVTKDGAVLHPPTGRRAGYGDLAARAARLPVPQDPPLKEPDQFRLIGRRVQRRDTPEKVDGRAVFGIDVRVPGMLVAVIARPPVVGGRVAGFDPGPALAVKGVRRVVPVDAGVAVVAETTWAARRGRDALRVQWDEGALAKLSSASISRMHREAADGTGIVARDEGDATSALERSATTIDAVYEVPYLAHATMEPMNCTAHAREDACEVWAPTQAQSRSVQAAARVTGLPPERITVHTTLLGGGFGRRLEADYVAEAVQVSKAVGAPVKVVWWREDDMRGGYYRPATYNVLRAGLDATSSPVAWSHRIVGPSIRARFRPSGMENGLDPTSVEGAANIPYTIPNIRVEWVRKESGVTVHPWRSVGSSQNAFVTECFVDELAGAAGTDPYRFRRGLLDARPRHRAVLDLAAEKAGWGRPPGDGRGRGIAVHESFGSFVAQVAEVAVADDGSVRVRRVVCAVDCGTVVNPDTVEAQMEGGIVFGLSAALHGAITLESGRVVQGNFDDYPVLRMHETPAIEVHILGSRESMGGVGEPGTPPIAPAVANAIFALTGRRIRSLPIGRLEPATLAPPTGRHGPNEAAGRLAGPRAGRTRS